MPEVAEAKVRLQRARRASSSPAPSSEGSLRLDIEPEDVPVLVGSAILGSAQAADPDAWRRYIAVVLDGLRAPA